jgi:hypothetical protein
MHKWALINRGLEFGQPEPVETYSSSPHLYSDLDIPQGVKGRLKPSPAAPHVEHGPREPRGDGRREGGTANRGGRPPRQRTRTGSGGGSRDGAASEAARAEGGGTHDGAASAPRKRTRRRRGGGGGASSAPPAA